MSLSRERSPRFAATRSIVLLAAAMASPACDGSSAPSPRVVPPPPTALDIQIDFPTFRATTDARTVVVRGRTTGAVDGVAVVIDDIVASSDDGFATWQATVPLDPGDNAIRARATFDGRTLALAAVQVRRDELAFADVRGLALEPGGQAVFALERASGRLLRIDTATGESALIASVDRGSGPALAAPQGLAIDFVATRAYTLTATPPALLTIDLATGDRESLDLVGAWSLGDGAELTLDTSTVGRPLLYVLTDRGTAVTVEPPSTGNPAGNRPATLIEVDLVQRRARTVSRGAAPFGSTLPAIGNGDPLVTPASLSIDAAGQRLLLVPNRATRDAWQVVDTVSGDRREVLAGILGRPMAGGAIARLSQSAGWAIASGDTLWTIDPERGEIRELSGPSRGNGPLWDRPGDVAVDPTSSLLACVDATQDALFVVDTVTGARRRLPTAVVGRGPALARPIAAALVPPGATVLVADAGRRAIFAIDVTTGDRQIVSGDSVGSGPALDDPIGMVLIDADELLVADRGANAVYSIDLATGRRSVSTAIDAPRAIAATPSGEVLLATRDTILGFDPKTGAHRAIASIAAGFGVELLDLRAIAVDVVLDRAICLDARIAPTVAGGPATASLRIVAVDLSTGERRLIATRDVVPSQSSIGSASIAFDSGIASVIVADGISAGPWRVDLRSGSTAPLGRTAITQPPIGVAVSSPLAATVDAAVRIAYVLDATRAALLAQDLVSGDTVLVSR